jgi:hypothetical protein
LSICPEGKAQNMARSAGEVPEELFNKVFSPAQKVLYSPKNAKNFNYFPYFPKNQAS